MKMKGLTQRWYSVVITAFFLSMAVFGMTAAVHARDLVIAYESDPDTLDLLSARHGPTAEAVGVNVMEHLLDTTPEGEIIAGLADEWKVFFFTYFSNAAKEWGQEEAMLSRYPEGDIYVGSQAAEGITILRAGGFAGKDDFYRGGGRPMPVSIDKWR